MTNRTSNNNWNIVMQQNASAQFADVGSAASAMDREVQGAFSHMGNVAGSFSVKQKNALSDAQRSYRQTQEALDTLRERMDRVLDRRASANTAVEVKRLDAAFDRLADRSLPLEHRLENLDNKIRRLGTASVETARDVNKLAAAEDNAAKASDRSNSSRSKGRHLPGLSEDGFTFGQRGAKSLPGGSIAGDVAKGLIGYNLAAAAVRNFTQSIGDLGGAIVNSTKDWETLNVGFTSILGSSKAARAELTLLQDMANKSPFQMQGLAAMAQQLLGAKLSLAETNKTIKDTINIVAFFGKGDKELSGITRAIAQIESKGRVYAEELNQISEHGVNAISILAVHFKKSVSETRTMIEAGKVGAQDLRDALHEFAANPAVANAAEKQSHTLAGLTSQAKDLFFQLGHTFGTPLLGEFRDRLEQIINDFRRPEVAATLEDWGVKAGQLAHAFFQMWDQFAKSAREAANAVKPFTDWIGEMIGGLPKANIDNIFAKPTEGASAFGQAIKLATNAIDPMKAAIQGEEDALKGLTRAAQDIRYQNDQRKDQLKGQLDLLNKQYHQQQAIIQLNRTDLDLADARTLAGDKYSRAGVAAVEKVKNLERQRSDEVKKMAFDSAKDKIDAQVGAIDAQQKVQLRGNELEQRIHEDRLARLRREKDALNNNTISATSSQAEVTTAYERFKSVHERMVEEADSAVVKQTSSFDVWQESITETQGLVDDLKLGLGDLSKVSLGQLAKEFFTLRDGEIAKMIHGVRVLAFTITNLGNLAGIAGKQLQGQAITKDEQAIMNKYNDFFTKGDIDLDSYKTNNSVSKSRRQNLSDERTGGGSEGDRQRLAELKGELGALRNKKIPYTNNADWDKATKEAKAREAQIENEIRGLENKGVSPGTPGADINSGGGFGTPNIPEVAPDYYGNVTAPNGAQSSRSNGQAQVIELRVTDQAFSTLFKKQISLNAKHILTETGRIS